MQYRDYLQKLIYKVIDPFVNWMIKVGVTPNFITTVGFLLNLFATCVFIYAGIYAEWHDFTYVGWGGGIILLAGLFDMLDGRLARVGKMSSSFGALYDSVLDRYSELSIYFGICYYLVLQGYFFFSIISFIALIGSLMVSYVRARAEGLGIECKVGWMQRPERIVLISLGAVFCGIFCNIQLFDSVYILVVPISIIAIFANITAFARIYHCHTVLGAQDKNKNH